MCGRKRGRKKREYHHYVVTMIFFLSIQHRKRQSRGALRFIRFDGGSHDVIAAARLFVYWKQTSSYLINDPLADTEKDNVNLFGCFFFRDWPLPVSFFSVFTPLFYILVGGPTGRWWRSWFPAPDRSLCLLLHIVSKKKDVGRPYVDKGGQFFVNLRLDWYVTKWTGVGGWRHDQWGPLSVFFFRIVKVSSPSAPAIMAPLWEREGD